MYIESVQASRKFMSAARAAARNKPALLVKAETLSARAPCRAAERGGAPGAARWRVAATATRP